MMPVLDRPRLVEAVLAVLALNGLPGGSANVSVRSYAGASATIPALLVFVRLNQWLPEALLTSKTIERHIRTHLFDTLHVRIGYVFWRVGSDVRTPDDLQERSQRGRVHRRETTAADSLRPQPGPNASPTDWCDFDAPDK